MNGPILSAKNKNLNQIGGTLPDVSSALLDWFQQLEFTTVVTTIENFQAKETRTTVEFYGVRQPMSPQQVAMRPEGQRKWKLETIHALPNLVLSPDDVIYFADVPYRVLDKEDWKEYGYVKYNITEDYTE